MAAGSLQVPGSAVSVEPTVASPLILGPVTTAGAADTTTSVGAESASFAPPRFEAVTSTRRKLPRSSAETMYVAPTAPSIALQIPASSQRCQTNVKVAWRSLQLPGSAVSLEPTVASPEMLGWLRAVGAAGVTGPTEAEALDTLTSPTCAV